MDRDTFHLPMGLINIWLHAFLGVEMEFCVQCVVLLELHKGVLLKRWVSELRQVASQELPISGKKCCSTTVCVS